MGNCICTRKQQEREQPVSIRREAGNIVVQHGGHETSLRYNSVIEVVYDYHLEEVRFITLGMVLRHPMRAAALDELDKIIKDFISDVFVD